MSQYLTSYGVEFTSRNSGVDRRNHSVTRFRHYPSCATKSV
jgi:hypothetical protein